MNDVSKTIGWAQRTWNPVVGCHGPGGTSVNPKICWYCYLQRFQDKGFSYEPTFKENKLQEPYHIKPSKIFVGSSGDTFGDWVPTEWIDRVIKVMCENPQHTFQSLTKNPKRYSEFKFPQNVWLGTTVDCNAGLDRIHHLVSSNEKNIKFVSFEPLLEDVGENVCLDKVNWIIIGSMTYVEGKKTIYPKKEWVQKLIEQAREKSIPIFLKDNLHWPIEIKEYPKHNLFNYFLKA
jgi:protein gp37